MGLRSGLAAQGVDYCEIRSLPSPRLAELCAATEGPTMRLAVSLPRADPWEEWERVKALALGPHGAAVTAVDFCNIEEGFPPKDKTAFFNAVAAFNAAHPDRALAILYHVGESYTDKSFESAIRWVQESAEGGAHRLGHAIALGVDPRHHGPHERRESAAERLDQIAHDVAHADALDDAGIAVDVRALVAERDRLLEEPAPVVHRYDEARLAELRRRQGVAAARIRDTGAVIEVCPTSNRRLLGLDDPAAHPVHRFLAEGLPVVVATDDPGVFGVTLAEELDWVCTHTGGGDALRRRLIETAWDSRSERLTGRAC
jgi:adenosine deaminase